MPRKTSWHKKNIVGFQNTTVVGNHSAIVDNNVVRDEATASRIPNAGGNNGDLYMEANLVPQNLRVAEQTVEYDDYGFAHVNVTFEWDAIDGVVQAYNLRVAEVND